MKILILKPSSLGDVVQAIPVLRMLRRHFAGAEIYWWIEKGSAPLLDGDPDIAGLIEFDRQRWASPWNYGDIWRCIRETRRHRFDLVLDLQALVRSGTIAWLANGKLVVGLQDWRELALGYYDISIPRPTPQTHAVDWYLETLKPLGVPVRWDFEWLPRRAAHAEEVASRWGLNGSGGPTVVLQPGARWENKRWPAAHFAELVTIVSAARPGVRFVVVGGNSDREFGTQIAGARPESCVDVTGRTSLPQAVEVIRSGAVMVTNDSGPMHIGAALGIPVVGLFGPTNPRRTGPYGQIDRALGRDDLPCVPCMKAKCNYPEPLACLRGIEPRRVAAEVIERLDKAQKKI